jgi:four helix bundle protein
LLALEIGKASSEGTFVRDYKLKDQINSASGSVMDNIAEGFGRGGRLEFVNFLSVTKGSNDETKSQLYRALDKGHLMKDKFDNLYALADEVGKSIHGLIEYLNATSVKGTKFKDRD